MKNNKNKNGFTLIELLVTIALMLSILALAIISITKVNDRFKERSFESVKDEVITAAKEYFNVNTYYLEPLGPQNASATVKVSIGELVNNDYLNSVTNPITGKKLNYCDYVLVEKKDKKLTYTYKEDSTTDPSSCNVHSYVEVTPAPNLGTLELKYIGEEGKKYKKKQWYKRNSKYVEGNNITTPLNDNEASKISPGVVVKLTANLKSNDYHVLNISTDDGLLLNTITNSDGTTIAYDTFSYGASVTEPETTTYTVVYVSDDNDSILTRTLTIPGLYVDIDSPSCKITLHGAKSSNGAYYCFELTNQGIFSDIKFNSKVIRTYFDNESGLVNYSLLTDNAIVDSDGDPIPTTSRSNIGELSYGTKQLSCDVYDIAGNYNVSNLENIKTEKLVASDILKDVVNFFKDSKYFCAETIGEPSIGNWTNKDRTITQYFRNNAGSEEKKEITFKTTQKKDNITRNIVSGPSCEVNVYVDKTPPTGSLVEGSVYLHQKDKNGNSLGRRKLSVTRNGNEWETTACLYNISGYYNIEFQYTATDGHSGVKQGSAQPYHTIVDKKNNVTHSGGCLITAGENVCTDTRILKVSDNAGNQGTIVTLKAKVGYIYNNLVSRPRSDYDRFCDTYAPVNKNNYRNYLKD